MFSTLPGILEVLNDSFLLLILEERTLVPESQRFWVHFLAANNKKIKKEIPISVRKQINLLDHLTKEPKKKKKT